MGISKISDSFHWLFKEYDRAGVRYCILRNYGLLPESLAGHDLDVLIDPEDIEKNDELMQQLCERVWSSYTKYDVRPEIGIMYWFFGDSFETGVDFLQLHFTTQVAWAGISLFDSKDALARRGRMQNFWIPNPAFEVSQLLIQPLLRDRRAKYMERVSKLVQSHTDQCQQVLGQCLGNSLSRRLVRLMSSGNWDAVFRLERLIRIMLVIMAIRKNGVASIYRMFGKVMNRIRITLFPKHHAGFLELVGACEREKMATTRKLESIFNDVFARTEVFWYPSDRSLESTSLILQMRQLVRSIKIRTRLWRFGLIICDDYSYVLLKASAQVGKMSRVIAKIILQFIPIPDQIILMTDRQDSSIDARLLEELEIMRTQGKKVPKIHKMDFHEEIHIDLSKLIIQSFVDKGTSRLNQQCD